MSDALIPAGTRIGHVHLKVADLERALGFYCGVLGFELTQRFGDQAAFVSAGGYPPHWTKHVGEQGWLAASAGHHRAVSHRNPLSHTRSACRCVAPAARRGHSSRCR